MHYLNDLADSLRAWFASRSTAARASIVLLTIIGVTWMVNVWTNPSEPEWVAVLNHHQWDAREINLGQLAFAKDGLNEYQLADGSIMVPRNRRDLYLKSLSKHQVLRTTHQESSITPFSAFLTRSQQQDYSLEQKKQRLRDQLIAMHNIEDATVEYAELRNENPFSPKRQQAIISLQTKQQTHLANRTVGMIRSLTRGMFPGLMDDQIEIIDLANEISYREAANDPEQNQAHIRLFERREEYLRRLQTSLASYPELSISVSVDPMPASEEYLNGEVKLASSQHHSSALTEQVIPDSRLLGSNGRVSLREVRTPKTNPTVVTGFRRNTRMTVSIAVPEALLRRVLGRTGHESSSDQGLDWEQSEQHFEKLKQQIEHTVRNQIPLTQNDQLHIILEPDLKRSAGNEIHSMPQLVQKYLERSWPIILVVVSVICFLLILNPIKRNREQT
ncbi:MAG TPA: hypothetical protein PKD64_10635 [Pirellulaceae bacterium]|nr:hypothetical protein [Pirellulaceae bacterium]HMO92637.1 hypothetical protein [Pirellulaceae bacterium]HMP70215.1 hypothetical protein [Pirellulaceae bacterium]